MLYLQPDTTPTQRLGTLEALAHDAATRADVIELARRIVGGATTETDKARALLAAVAAPRYIGDTPIEPGQWLDTNVAATVARGGDCLDRTFALLSLAYASGLDAMAVWIADRGGPLDHVVARLRSDGLWHWADPLAVPRAVLGMAPRGGALLTARGALG